MEQAEIGRLERSEIPQAARVLGAAFVTNPTHVAVFRGHGEEELRRHVAMFAVILEHAPLEVLVARQEGRIAGVTGLVEWPRCQTTPAQSLKMLPAMFMAVKGVLPRLAKWRGNWASHDPKKPHWHLGPVAVAPEAQGRGVGSALLTRFCERVDEHGGAAYLETDKLENVRLYRRFGFEITEEDELYGARNWFMWREPAVTLR